MKAMQKHLRQLAVVLLLAAGASMTACSNESGPGSSSPLPTPSINCNGSSCIN